LKRASPTRQRLTALGLLGLPLLTFPILSLPSGQLFGLPGSYAYLFGVWSGLIALAVWVAERKDK